MVDHPKRWDSAYEWKATLLLALGFGLVALDRWIIAPLIPVMSAELHLNYQDAGNAIGVIAISWGVFAIIFGRVSDSLGRKKILVPAVILFSILCGLTGMSTGIMMLLALRVLMGTTEGAYTPVAVATVAEASSARRRGLNQGFMMSTFPLFGLGFGPIIATQLLAVVPSWRWVFAVVAIPGLIVAFLIWRIIREPAHLAAAPGAPPQAPPEALKVEPPKVKWSEALKAHNVIVATLAMLTCMVGVFTLSGLMSSYLTDGLHMNLQQVGLVMSALGFGGFFGEFMLCGASDYIGRRWSAVLAFVLAAGALYLFSRTGPEPWTLFALLFVCTFFCFGLLALLSGPVATEAVPPMLTASAIGLVAGVAEIFGGGLGPVMGGTLAQRYGIASMLTLALGALVVGAVISLFLKETAPRLTGAAQEETAGA